jgi:hypothetical protein
VAEHHHGVRQALRDHVVALIGLHAAGDVDVDRLVPGWCFSRSSYLHPPRPWCAGSSRGSRRTSAAGASKCSRPWSGCRYVHRDHFADTVAEDEAAVERRGCDLVKGRNFR